MRDKSEHENGSIPKQPNREKKAQERMDISLGEAEGIPAASVAWISSIDRMDGLSGPEHRVNGARRNSA